MFKTTKNAYSSDIQSIYYNAENVDVARFLIERGAEINVKSSDGTTPLHYAVSWGICLISCCKYVKNPFKTLIYLLLRSCQACPTPH